MSSMFWMFVTGTPVVCRTMSWIALDTVSGATLVRTIHAIGPELCISMFIASGICASGTYMIGPWILAMPFARALPTTPTICRTGSSASSFMVAAPPPIRICSASGSPPSGQYWSTNAWLTMTTGGAEPLSLSLNARPRMTGMLKVSKYPGTLKWNPPPPVNGPSFARPMMFIGNP